MVVPQTHSLRFFLVSCHFRWHQYHCLGSSGPLRLGQGSLYTGAKMLSFPGCVKGLAGCLAPVHGHVLVCNEIVLSCMQHSMNQCRADSHCKLLGLSQPAGDAVSRGKMSLVLSVVAWLLQSVLFAAADKYSWSSCQHEVWQGGKKSRIGLCFCFCLC